MKDFEQVFNIQRMLDRTKAAFAKCAEGEHTALLRQMIGDADLVFGVLNDDTTPKGWDKIIIKGEQALQMVVQNKTSAKFRTIAIPCRKLEEAIAMKRLFGGLN